MRITKLEHATTLVETEGRTLVIDPGGFTRPLGDLHDVDAVVVTHEHADHWTPDQLTAILDANPGIPVFGPEGVARAASGFDVTVVAPGETATAGVFTLRFFGGRHAEIHSSIPIIDNVGVLVNETLYYPGDSFAIPEGVAVPVLAAPVGAPWMRIGEGMDYVLAVAPKRAYYAHEGTLSHAGLGMHADRIGWATAQGGGEFSALKPGESIEV